MKERKGVWGNMTIGQLAKETGENSQTIRYYENIGLLPRADRNQSGYRVYDSETVNKLKFIQRAKAVGFTLEEIKTLIRLADGKISKCRDVRPFVEEKLKRVKIQLLHLKEIEKGLTELVAICRTTEALEACPILERLVKNPSKVKGIKNEH